MGPDLSVDTQHMGLRSSIHTKSVRPDPIVNNKGILLGPADVDGCVMSKGPYVGLRLAVIVLDSFDNR